MLHWKMAAGVQGHLTKEEWRMGFKAFNADTIAKMKEALPRLEEEVFHKLKEFYEYAFGYCLPGKKEKFLDINSSCDLIILVLSSRYQEQVDSFVEFLRSQSKYKLMDANEWAHFLTFCEKINFTNPLPDRLPDLESGAWPPLYIDFFHRIKGNEFGDVREKDVKGHQQDLILENECFTLRDYGGFLPPPKWQGNDDVCDLYSQLAYMEAMMRKGRPPHVRNIGPLSPSYVLDYVKKAGVRSLKEISLGDLNEHFSKCISGEGVPFVADYGDNLLQSIARYDLFRRRRKRMIKLSPDEKFDRQPAPNYNFEDSVRSHIKLRLEPMLGTMKLRRGFQRLPAGEIMKESNDYDANPDKIPLEHTVVLTGFGTLEGTRYFEVLNSWGDTWSDSGYGYVLEKDLECAWTMVMEETGGRGDE